MKKKNVIEIEVQHGDPLVVAGQQPAQQTVFLGDEVHPWESGPLTDRED